MSSKETRHEQYLRILTVGPSGDDDNEAIRHLVDKGYTDSKYLLSFTDSSRKVASTIWRGPNPNGLDYIDDLQLKVANLNPEKLKPIPNNNNLKGKHGAARDNRYWNEKPIGILFIGVATAVVMLFITYFLSKHFGISFG